MAKFVLTAQLQLQAPNNASKVVKDIQNQLKGVSVPVEIKGAAAATKQINELTDATRGAGTAAEAMGRSFGLAVKRFAAFTVASRAVSLFTNTLSRAIDEAIAFQREVVRVSQVTGKSVKDLRSLTKTIDSLSTGLGVSSKELLDTAVVLSQAGIKAGDLDIALSALAKTTLAPNFDNLSETAEGAVAILAQFGKGVGALDQQLSSLNAVAGAFAVESDDLIDAVRRFGGVFKASGGSLEELLAVFTAVRATTRESGESISTGLRTIFTRIQRPKTIEFLKQFGVELTDLNGKFVGPFEAAKRLAEAFGNLEQGDITFIRVAEELGGYRQIGKVIPLLQQFAVAQEAVKVAQEGSDSLTKDAATAQQALAVQITRVKEEFLALVRSIADSDSFQLFARTALEVASALIKVADTLKPLLPLITTLLAFQFAKGLGSFASSAGAAVRGLGKLGEVQTKNNGGRIHAFASGGVVPGTGNTDSVPAMLTPGEFVIRKSSVKKIGAGTLAAMNENRYAKGGTVGAVLDIKPDKFGGLFLTPPDAPDSSITALKGQTISAANVNKLILQKLNSRNSLLLTSRDKGFEKEDESSIRSRMYSKASKRLKPAAEYREFLKTSKSIDTPEKQQEFITSRLGGQELKQPKATNAFNSVKIRASQGALPGFIASRSDLNSGLAEEFTAASQAGIEAMVERVSQRGFSDIGPKGKLGDDLRARIKPAVKSLFKDDPQGKINSARASIEGYLLEAVIGAFSGVNPQSSGAVFDFENLSSGSSEGWSDLFGKESASRIAKLKAADAKRSLTKDTNDKIIQKVGSFLSRSEENISDYATLDIERKALGGLIQAFEQGGKVIVAAEANSKLQGSHIGGDVVLDNAQLAEVFKATNNIKLKRSILNRYKGVDTSTLSTDEVHKQFAATDISAAEIDDLKNSIGLQLKYPTKLNFPSIYNQALRETDPRLVSKNDLSKFISGSTKLVSPVSGSANKSDQLSSTLNKPEVLSGIKTSLISQLRSIPTLPENTINGIETYDSDTELNSLQPAFIKAVKDVKSELAESLTSKADFIFKGGQKLTIKGKLRSSQDRFQAAIPQAKLLGGEIQKFAKAGKVLKKGEEATGTGIFDSDKISGGTNVKKAILEQIKASKKPYQVISGPAGSGKTTFATSRFGNNFILSAADLVKYSKFVVLSGASKTKTGDFSADVQSLLSGASGITLLSPDQERLMKQRQGRLDSAMSGNLLDERSVGALQGTLKSPTDSNEELFKRYANVEILRQYASGGGVAQRFARGSLVKPDTGMGPDLFSELEQTMSQAMTIKDPSVDARGERTIAKILGQQNKKVKNPRSSKAKFEKNEKGKRQIKSATSARLAALEKYAADVAAGREINYTTDPEGQRKLNNAEIAFNKILTQMGYDEDMLDPENYYRLGGLIQRFANGTIGQGVKKVPLIDDITENAKGAILPNPKNIQEIIKAGGAALDVDRTLIRTVGDTAYAKAPTPEAKQEVLQRYFRGEGRLKDIKESPITQFGKALIAAVDSGQLPTDNLSIISKSQRVPGVAEHLNKIFGIPIANMAFTQGGNKQAALDAINEKGPRELRLAGQGKPPVKRAAGGPAPSDTVPALLTPGEFVFSKGAAQRIGYGNLNRMNKQGIAGFAKGGTVGIQKFNDGGNAAKSGLFSFNTDIKDAEKDINSFGKTLVKLTGVVASAIFAIQNFGDKSIKATDEQAAYTIGAEKAVAALAQITGIIAITQSARTAIIEWAKATNDSKNKQADNTADLSSAVDSAVDKLENIDTTTIKANKVVTEATAAGAATAGAAGAGGDPEVEKLVTGVLEGKTYRNKKEEEAAQIDDLIKGVEAGSEGMVARKETPQQNIAVSANAEAEMQKKQAEISKASARSNIDAAKSAILDTDKEIKNEVANYDAISSRGRSLVTKQSSLIENEKQIRGKASQINDQYANLQEKRKNVGSAEELKAIDSALEKLSIQAKNIRKEFDNNRAALEENARAITTETAALNQSKAKIDELKREQQNYNNALSQSRAKLGPVKGSLDAMGFAAKKATIALKNTSGFKAASSAFSAASTGVKKLTSDIKNLAARAKAGISSSFATGGTGKNIAARAGVGAAIGGGAVGLITSLGSQIASGFEEYFKRAEEQAKASGNINEGVKAAGNASIAADVGSLFTISGLAGAYMSKGGLQGFGQRVSENANRAEYNTASEFVTSISQDSIKKLQDAQQSRKPIDEAAITRSSIASFAKARSEASDLKGPEREKATAELDAKSSQYLTSLAEGGLSLEGLKNTAMSLSGGNEELRKKLLEQVKTIEVARKAQEQLNKANFDSLKMTSAFGAAADAASRLVSGLETGANSLAIYAEELDKNTGRLGVDSSEAINAIESELLATAGNVGGGSLRASITEQASVARAVSGFSVNAGAELGNLKIRQGAEGREDIENALQDAIPKDADPATKAKMEALISKSVSEIQGDPSQIDLSKLAKDIMGDMTELSKGFNETAKIQAQHNQLMTGLYQKREQLEQKAADAANQAIETQIEAAKTFEEFGGKKFTPKQESEARIAQFNNIGALGGLGAQLSTGDANDIRNVGNQLAKTFSEQTDQVIGATLGKATGQRGIGPFAGPGGAAADKRPEAEAANKALIQFTKQRIAQIKEELSIIEKKNAAEKSSLEALLSGDVESFLDQQAAAGAATALETGNANLTGLFSASALGAGFKQLEGRGLSDEQTRKAENLTLQRFGIQSTGVLSGTTTEQEALKSQGRELAGALGELSQQEAAFAQAEIAVNNATITAAQLTFERKLEEVGTTNSGQKQAAAKGLAMGGLVYASKGIFVPRGSDTVPAMLTPGEFVVNRASVQRGNNLQILKAMNSGGAGDNNPGASSPGAMRGGGKVGYYNNGGVVDSVGNAFANAIPQLTTVFNDFAATVDKLVNTKFQVALDPTNININFNGASFLSSLKEDLKNEILNEVGNEIQKFKTNNSGGLVKKNVL